MQVTTQSNRNSSTAPARSLAKKKVAEKKVAITVFSFPPDKGNVGTAAYLNVFGSIWKVLKDLQNQGYTVNDLPEQEEDLIKTVSRAASNACSIPDWFRCIKVDQGMCRCNFGNTCDEQLELTADIPYWLMYRSTSPHHRL